jgi:hypothetical protein
MYNPVAISHFEESCTPSQPNPIPQATKDSAIKILGLQVPKSILDQQLTPRFYIVKLASKASQKQKHKYLNGKADSI